jgi:hypothetical protein
MKFHLAGAFFLACILLPGPGKAQTSFNRDIRPIVSELKLRPLAQVHPAQFLKSGPLQKFAFALFEANSLK